MSDSGNCIRERGYYARRIWHGPNDTCRHVWLAPAPRRFATSPWSRIFSRQVLCPSGGIVST